MTVTNDYTPIPTVTKVPYPTARPSYDNTTTITIEEAEALGYELIGEHEILAEFLSAGMDKDKALRAFDLTAAAKDITATKDAILALHERGETTVGKRTLADLTTGDAPKPLAPPYLTPDVPTILYGPGGVGKGMLSVFFALHLASTGLQVMVIDYEHHEREWGNRARNMGGTEEQLRAIHYRAPFSNEWTAERGPLHEVAELLREDCDLHDIDVVVIDSYTAATSNGDSLGGAGAAEEYFRGLSRIGRTSLTIAHVTGSQQKWPPKPFGSVFVHNFARETWAVESIKEEDTLTLEEWQLQPKVIALELRNQKMSERSKERPHFIAFSFYIDGHITVDTKPPHTKTLEVIVEEVLTRNRAPMEIKQLAKVIQDETDITYAPSHFRSMFSKSRKFSATDGIPKKWGLRE